MAYDRNTPYNELPPLPPPDQVHLDVDVLNAWGLASRALSRVDGQIRRLPNPEMLINTLALQEAKSSSEIENIFTTDDELYRAISNERVAENVSMQAKEVLRYREALWTGFYDLKEQSQITSVQIVKVMQAIRDTREGIRAPQAQTVIRRGNSEFRAGEVVYTPPRGAGVIESMLENMIDFMNNDNEIDPLIKMAIAHYQFESIHPFTDGNGRTGRIINLLYLMQSNLLSTPSIYLSREIIKTKDQYYYLLGTVRQNQSFKAWVIYMLKVVENSSNHVYNVVDIILDQMEASLEYGKSNLKWYRKEVNELIYTQPYTKYEHLAKLLDRSSRTTVKKYMDQLVASRILRPEKKGLEVFYVNDLLINILSGE
jgi:cell filamentation protein, protein adenylyltransferase